MCSVAMHGALDAATCSDDVARHAYAARGIIALVRWQLQRHTCQHVDFKRYACVASCTAGYPISPVNTTTCKLTHSHTTVGQEASEQLGQTVECAFMMSLVKGDYAVQVMACPVYADSQKEQLHMSARRPTRRSHAAEEHST
jgi:hypothetical protein